MTDLDKRIDEIKPCPFCGGVAELQLWNYIQCGNCGACTGVKASDNYGDITLMSRLTKPEAIKAWNTRAIESKLQAELAARDWHDISAAPKDGTHLLITDGKQIDIGWFGADWNIDSKGEWLRGDGDDFSTGYYFTPCKPTHFQYLPQPPVITKQGD